MPKDRRKQTKASKVLDIFRKKEMRGKSAWERKYRKARNISKETKKDEFFTWKGKKYKASYRTKVKEIGVPVEGPGGDVKMSKEELIEKRKEEMKRVTEYKGGGYINRYKGGGIIQHD